MMSFFLFVFLIAIVIVCDRLEKKWNDDEPK